METMSSSIEPVVPRTANLLACKQWWRVCFLYGDQQKYYRQVYGKAAAQRLALSNTTTANDTDNKNDNCTTTIMSSETEILSSENRDYDIITDFIDAQLGELQDLQHKNNKKNKNTNNNNNNETSDVTAEQREQTVALFPAKYQSTSINTASMTMKKSKKLLSSLRGKHGHNNSNKSNQHKEKQNTKRSSRTTTTTGNVIEASKGNTRITVLDDPFLFGIDEDHLGDLIRPKQYTISATDDISKYFNYYVDQQQPQQQQQTQQQEQQICTDVHLDSEPRPTLPPKKMSRPIATEPAILHLNQSDLQFLNMNLQDHTVSNNETHDISFTFNEENCAESSEINEKSLEQFEKDNEELSLQYIKREHEERGLGSNQINDNDE